MASLADRALVAANPTFVARVRVAVVKLAQDIQAGNPADLGAIAVGARRNDASLHTQETLHVARAKVARAVLLDPERWAVRFAEALAAREVADTASDLTLINECSGSWNAFALPE